MLGKNRIWQKNNTYCYTLPNGSYERFLKNVTIKEMKNAFQKVDYYDTYKHYIHRNGTKFGILDNIRMYPFVMPLNTWIFANLKSDVKNFIPNYDDFCNFYISNYCHRLRDNLTFNENACYENVEFTEIALKVRLGYPFGSFLREFYLRHYLIQYFAEKQIPINVMYNLHDDFYNAIDVIIEKDKKILGVCILDASSKSKEMKNRKDNYRHKTFHNQIKISNKDGFLKDFDVIPRMNFYTEVFGDTVEHLGEINVPNEKELEMFAKEIVKYFS